MLVWLVGLPSGSVAVAFRTGTGWYTEKAPQILLTSDLQGFNLPFLFGWLGFLVCFVCLIDFVSFLNDTPPFNHLFFSIDG